MMSFGNARVTVTFYSYSVLKGGALQHDGQD